MQVVNHQSENIVVLSATCLTKGAEVIATTIRAYLSALLESGEENVNERYQKVFT